MRWTDAKWILPMLIGVAAFGTELSDCVLESVKEPPFLLSKSSGVAKETYRVQGEKVVLAKNHPAGGSPADEDWVAYENFRNQQKEVAGWISRGTVVVFDPSTPPASRTGYLDALASGKDVFLPVQVASTHKTYQQFASYPKRHVENGDRGYVFSKSLEPVTDQKSLIVREDSKFFFFSRNSDSTVGAAGDSLAAGSILSPVMRDGKYVVSRCHLPDGTQVVTHLFKAQDAGDAWKEKVVGLADSTCLPPMRVIDNSQLAGLLDFARYLNAGSRANPVRLADFEFNEWGYVRLPIVNETPGANIVGDSPDGTFVHYQGNDPMHSDLWGKPDTICGLLRLTRAWKDLCKERFGGGDKCLPQVGDIAFVSPLKGEKGRCPLGHKSHNSGRCIDIRPFRRDGAQRATRMVVNEEGNSDDPSYSSEMTTAFFSLAHEMGASGMIAGDPRVVGGIPGAKLDAGEHGDHMHICFDPEKRPFEGCGQ